MLLKNNRYKRGCCVNTGDGNGVATFVYFNGILKHR
jgi:hypothetical protein